MIELTIVAVVAMLCGTAIYLKHPAPSANKEFVTNNLSGEIEALKVQLNNLRSTMTQLQLKEGMRR